MPDGTLVTVTTTTPVTAGLITWNGRAGNEEHAVDVQGAPARTVQPWLATEFAIASTDAKVADFSIDWKNLPANAGLFAPAGKLALPVKLTRTDVASPVRLTLLTSQTPPFAGNQPNAAAAIRLREADGVRCEGERGRRAGCDSAGPTGRRVSDRGACRVALARQAARAGECRHAGAPNTRGEAPVAIKVR